MEIPFILDGYAPFLSMTGRETFLDVNDSVIAAPGPGAYDPGQAQFRIVGGHTLSNTVRCSPMIVLHVKKCLLTFIICSLIKKRWVLLCNIFLYSFVDLSVACRLNLM